MAAAPSGCSRPSARERGLTLLELVVALGMLGVLIAVALPCYVAFSRQATEKTAASNVREMVPALEAYKTETGSYRGLTLTVLKDEYELNIDDSRSSPYELTHLGDDSYCVEYRMGDLYAVKDGPRAKIVIEKRSDC